MSNFLDLVMEAKGRKPIKIQVDDEPEDYTQNEEGEGNDEPEETSEGDSDTETEANDADGTDEEPTDEEDAIEPTDYTEEEEEFSEEGDSGATSEGEPAEDDDTIPEDDDVTDYTDDEDGTNPEDEPTDYTDDGTDPDSTGDDSNMGGEEMSEEEEGPTSDDRKNKGLLDDLIKLKGIVQNFINKLSSMNLNNVEKVKIVGQISNNLTQLSEQIHNYIVYRFQHETYVRNLYFYNYSVEGVNVNINMLKKISKMNDNK